MPRRNPQRNIPGLNKKEPEQVVRKTVTYSNVGDWAKAASDLFTEMQDKTSGWFSTQTRDNYTKKLTDLYDQKDTWYSRFKDNAEATGAIDAIVEDLKKAQEAIEQNGTYYSQWKTQEEYDDWYAYYGVDKDTRIKNATANLETKTKAKGDAYGEYNSHLNTDMDDIDFMTYDSEAAEKKGRELLGVYQQAEAEEKKARQILWDAKYDTMTAAELQAVMEGLQDKAEKDYVSQLQKNANLAERKQELADLNAVFDPESEYYDPAFLEKSAYQSTKLTDGSLGESDTGYADIDYEFINGNQDISELIVGLDRNYYQISDEERQIYNYWHNYDREHGTNKADRYLELLQETFNARDSELDYSKIEGNVLLEIAYGAKSGLSKFGRAIDTLYRQPEGYIPMTSTEMTAQKAYEGLEDFGNVRWYNMKTGQWEDKIAGQSLGQLGFSAVEDAAYNLPGKIVGGLTGQTSKVAGAIVNGILSGMSDNGAAYREMINQGYTSQQARDYGNLVGLGSGTLNTAANLVQNGAEDLWKSVFGGQTGLEGIASEALGKILTNNDWLGITDSLQSIVEDHARKAITGEEKADQEDLRTTAQSAVTAKAMDKIFNQMQANPEDLSLDLRQSLLQSLKDPTAREKIEKIGSFTPMQLEEIIAGLENAGDQDEGIGTYVGDYYYGPSGLAVSRQYLQPLADKAFRNRSKYLNDPEAAARFAQYLR